MLELSFVEPTGARDLRLFLLRRELEWPGSRVGAAVKLKNNLESKFAAVGGENGRANDVVRERVERTCLTRHISYSRFFPRAVALRLCFRENLSEEEKS